MHVWCFRSEKSTNKIYVFDGTQSSGTPLHTFETLHQSVVVTIVYNPVYEVAVSVDKAGIIEYWTGPKHEFQYPKNVKFQSKLETDLFDFVKNKTYPTALAFSPDGKKMASISLDRKVFLICLNSIFISIICRLFLSMFF